MQTNELATCKLERVRHFPSRTTTVITACLLQIAVKQGMVSTLGLRVLYRQRATPA